MMGSSSLCEFNYFVLGVSGIVLLMLCSAFSLILSRISVFVLIVFKDAAVLVS